MEMKAIIKLDMPECQIGQDVSVYFPDTMLKHGKCKLLKEQKTANLYKCPNCGTWVSAENVVRCKDCKNWTVGDIGTYCPYHHDARPDWFCADGERR